MIVFNNSLGRAKADKNLKIYSVYISLFPLKMYFPYICTRLENTYCKNNLKVNIQLKISFILFGFVYGYSFTILCVYTITKVNLGFLRIIFASFFPKMGKKYILTQVSDLNTKPARRKYRSKYL
jgi:hypothetical protein